MSSFFASTFVLAAGPSGAPSAGEGRKTVFPPGCERSVVGDENPHCWMQSWLLDAVDAVLVAGAWV